jgi:hypothetical protein
MKSHSIEKMWFNEDADVKRIVVGKTLSYRISELLFEMEETGSGKKYWCYLRSISS